VGGFARQWAHLQPAGVTDPPSGGFCIFYFLFKKKAEQLLLSGWGCCLKKF
jgi:hypothetical protein